MGGARTRKKLLESSLGSCRFFPFTQLPSVKFHQDCFVVCWKRLSCYHRTNIGNQSISKLVQKISFTVGSLSLLSHLVATLTVADLHWWTWSHDHAYINTLSSEPSHQWQSTCKHDMAAAACSVQPAVMVCSRTRALPTWALHSVPQPDKNKIHLTPLL